MLAIADGTKRPDHIMKKKILLKGKKKKMQDILYVLIDPRGDTWTSHSLTKLVERFNANLPDARHHLRYNGCLWALSAKCKRGMYKQYVLKKVSSTMVKDACGVSGFVREIV